MTKLTYNCIKQSLAAAQKSNIELAEHLKVHEQTVSSWCVNDSQPGYDTLFKIAAYLGVEARELIALRKDLKPVKKRSTRGKPKVK